MRHWIQKTAHPERILSEGASLWPTDSQAARCPATRKASFRKLGWRGFCLRSVALRRRLGIGRDRPWVLPRTACLYYLRMSWGDGLLWIWVLGHHFSPSGLHCLKMSLGQVRISLDYTSEASPFITWTSALFMVHECSAVNFSTVPTWEALSILSQFFIWNSAPPSFFDLRV